jgi:hypothetical protein
MSESLPSERQRQLLRVVNEGGGDWDARHIDLAMGSRYRPIAITVLKELKILEDAGLVPAWLSVTSVAGEWADVGRSRLLVGPT